MSSETKKDLTDDQVKITESIMCCMQDPQSSFACRAAKQPTVASSILIAPQDGTLVLLN